MMAAAMMPLGMYKPITLPLDPYLAVGSNVVITGNVSAVGIDNVYLDRSGDAVIAILADAADLDIGVTLSTGAGMFGWTNETDYAASFFSDREGLGVRYTADRELELVRYVRFVPEEVANATAAVYVDDVEIEKTGDIYFIVSNATAKVKYSVASWNFYFADGTQSKSYDLDTSKSIVKTIGVLAEAPKPTSIKLGRPLQRYPWNGIVDVPFRAKNWPSSWTEGVCIEFLVKSGGRVIQVSASSPFCQSGSFTGNMTIDFRGLDLPTNRGEAEIEVLRFFSPL